jgi:hypothetical protein
MIAFSACSDPRIACQAPECIFVKGELSDQSIVALNDAGSALGTVYVNSRGGKVGIAALAGKILLDQDVHLFIVEECSSACAEYLMTAAKRVTTIGEPIVGLHGNSLFREYLYQEQGYYRPAHCKGMFLSVLEDIYAKRNLRMDFALEQLGRLGPIDLEFYLDAHGCPLITRYDTQGRMWYPTTDELEALLGLHVEGRLCADNPQCRRKLNK